MWIFKRIQIMLLAAVLIATLSACQPIQPESAAQARSDADKIALVRAWEERFVSDNIDIVDTLFTKNATFAFDPSPSPDRSTGKYNAPVAIHVEGHEAIKNILSVIDSLGGGVTIGQPRIQDEFVIAPGIQTATQSPAFGTPGTEMPGTFLMKVTDCKASMIRFVISQEALDAMPAEAEVVGARCEDSYKSFVLQRFINGLWNGDAALAGLPWSEDATFRFDGLPLYDEANKSFTIDPARELKASGWAEIDKVIATLITEQTGITPDMAAEKIDGSTLTLPFSLTQYNPSPEFGALSLTDLAGLFTATFTDRCEISNLDLTYPQATLDALNQAKTK